MIFTEHCLYTNLQIPSDDINIPKFCSDINKNSFFKVDFIKGWFPAVTLTVVTTEKFSEFKILNSFLLYDIAIDLSYQQIEKGISGKVIILFYYSNLLVFLSNLYIMHYLFFEIYYKYIYCHYHRSYLLKTIIKCKHNTTVINFL